MRFDRFEVTTVNAEMAEMHMRPKENWKARSVNEATDDDWPNDFRSLYSFSPP